MFLFSVGGRLTPGVYFTREVAAYTPRRRPEGYLDFPARLPRLPARRQGAGSTATIAVMDLRSRRNALGLSQSRLARLSGVSRFKVCLFELGDGSLKPEEQQSISAALRAETDRLRSLPSDVEFDQPDSATDTGGAQ